MQPLATSGNNQLLQQLSRLLYRCLEEVGSTKAALFLAAPGTRQFQLVSHYGWPRTAPPPQLLDAADPLVLLVQRQRRPFVVNDAANYRELEAFGQGKQDPHYFIAPIYDHGEWIGLLLQRDLNRGEPFNPGIQELPTQSICQEIVAAIRYFSTPRPPRSPAQDEHPLPFPEAEAIRVPPPPTFPEQRNFFWEAAALLSRVVPSAAVAMWICDPMANRPILAYSPMPLSAQLEQEVVAHIRALLPDLADPNLQLLTKAEHFDQPPIPGPFRSILPIMLEEQFGDADILMVFRVEDAPFLPQDQDSIGAVARMLGLFLEEGRIHERYHQSFLSVSHRILASAGERVPAIRSQSVNTAELSRNLARRLELSSAEMEAVTISAILHDVGTLLLDRRILDKPTLTPEDMEKVQTHPILASTFLKDFHFPFDILRIIRHHHEQWDGKGYPDGIAGEAIPIESRIIHLVESYQVMRSGTTYRAAKPRKTALAELRRLSGTHFEPHMVEVFIQMLGSSNA